MADQPNILVIWGDDIGITNLSCYSDGLMGYRTPNIDRIANEGMLFTDSYGEQSCTAGRSSFITGQSVYPHRPDQGRHSRAPTSACRPRTRRSPSCSSRWATPPGSSARTTSATCNKYLPTVHGFDEFFGNLYHLNAEEEPEHARLPDRRRTSRSFREHFGPRGVHPLAGRPTRTTRPRSRAGAASASSGSRTPGR